MTLVRKPFPFGARHYEMALALVLVAIIGGNAFWLFLDRHPTDMDQSRYMLMVLDFAKRWTEPDPGSFVAIWLGNHASHPHLVPLLASIPFAVFDCQRDAAYFLMTLFHASIVLLVFLIGRRIQSPSAGLVAAFLATGIPLLARFSRYFLLEEAAAFFVIATLYALLRSDYFTSASWSAVTGVAVGLGLLTKWTTIVFVGPPVAIVAAAALFRRSAGPVASRLALSMAGCAIVAAPWYIYHSGDLLRFFTYAEQGRLFAGEGPGFAQLALYLLMLWATAGWPFVLLGAMGLLYLAVRPTVEHLAILATFVVPLCVFAFMISTRDVRHLLPGLPAIALATGLAVRSLRRDWLRNVLTAAALLLSVISAAYIAWGLGDQRSKLTIGHYRALLLPEAHPPDRRHWRLENLLERAASDHRSTVAAGRAPVRVIAGNLPFRTESFAFAAALRFPTLNIVHVQHYIPPGRPKHRHLGIRSILAPGYLLVREGDINANSNGMFEYSRALQRYLDRTTARTLFRTIHVEWLPTGHVARLLRVQPHRCDHELLDFLDLAHEIDHDDPDIASIVEECAQGETGRLDSLWHQLGRVISFAPDDGERVAMLRELARARADVRWSQRLLADSLVSQQRFVEAAEIYTTLGDDAPYLCSPHLAAGDAWQRVGATAQGMAAYRRAITVSPDCARAHRELATSLMASGQVEAARHEERKVELLDHQSRLGPSVDTARIRLLLGDLAARDGELEEARYHYSRGRENEPTNLEVLRRLEALKRTEGTAITRSPA